MASRGLMPRSNSTSSCSRRARRRKRRRPTARAPGRPDAPDAVADRALANPSAPVQENAMKRLVLASASILAFALAAASALGQAPATDPLAHIGIGPPPPPPPVQPVTETLYGTPV